MENELLRQLYAKYRNELFLYLYSLCKNYELAEDILQETFVKAILSLKENHPNIKAWLYMVGRNIYYNYAKREMSKIDSSEMEDIPDNKNMIESLIDSENRRLLYKALDSLAGIKKEVLQLFYFSNMSQRDISSMLNISQENVRVLIYRGKREIKNYLEANGYEI
ncbi:MAG: RNA polymerase sigma factor [Lachnospiraceae bacterium]|nr:RNA polymerase sigma factor [Lachnospiraceae bacterium]